MASDIAIAAYVKAKRALAKAEDTSIWHYRGTVPSYSNLPASPSTGDVYTTSDTGDEWSWNGTTWNHLGTLISIDSEFSSTSENPVQNKVIKAKLDQIDTDLTELGDLGTGIRSLALNSMVVVEDLTSTSKTFTPEGNTRYIFGELTALTVSALPEDGIVDILFDSGSTATVLTLPNTAILPEWFDPTDLDADMRYELNFAEGNAVITSWPIATS